MGNGSQPSFAGYNPGAAGPSTPIWGGSGSSHAQCKKAVRKWEQYSEQLKSQIDNLHDILEDKDSTIRETAEARDYYRDGMHARNRALRELEDRYEIPHDEIEDLVKGRFQEVRSEREEGNPVEQQDEPNQS